jgi:acetyl esterase/lipase
MLTSHRRTLTRGARTEGAGGGRPRPLVAVVVLALAAAGVTGCRIPTATAAVGSADGSAVAAPPAPTARTEWTEDEVSFQAGGVTVYGTYRHPKGGAGRVPAALLIAGSGPTDRNGNDATLQHLDTLRTVAGWLSEDGVASLRYDKLFSGRTGAGPYAGRPGEVGVEPFRQEAEAALRFLASRPGVDRRRLTVVGHSEGALYALLLSAASRARPREVPPVHALVLLEPLSRRYLDTIAEQLNRSIDAQQQAGVITPAEADRVRSAMNDAIARLRATGTVQPDLPYGLSTILSPRTARYLHEADRYDPAALAGALPSGMPLLVSCSDADIQVSCADAGRVVAAGRRAAARVWPVRLHGVDHVLKEDDSGTGANYDLPLPFSRQLRDALRAFLAAGPGRR